MIDLIEPTLYWTWAYSDHLSNTQRGVLAEYIVGTALDAVSTPRREWDAYDLITPSGIKVEVKTSAYLQSWIQTKESAIIFDIGKKRSWYAETNTYSENPERASDVYVFCVFAEKDRSKANPLDLSQWFFLVAATSKLNSWFEDQAKVGLAVLEAKCKSRLPYSEIGSAVRHEYSQLR